jgi:NAD(P)-dependent dehydrogenase (short-subunit alcohol dehydrogenase family)
MNQPEPVFSNGRRALVTGGASGLGLGVAQRLLAAGATVAIADLPASLARLPEKDQTAFVRIGMDVTDEASVRAGVGSALDSLGGLDTLVNSAGVFQYRALEGISTREWDWILGVNLRGTFLVLRESMPHLKASGRGRVVNISSDAGKTGFPLLAAYCASKFGVVGLTQAVAAEVGRDGVRVNAVCPATIAETGMGSTVIEQKIELGYGATREEVLERGAASFPLQRVGRVTDVVDAVIFLLSDSSGWITGESINVDGGSLAG